MQSCMKTKIHQAWGKALGIFNIYYTLDLSLSVQMTAMAAEYTRKILH